MRFFLTMKGSALSTASPHAILSAWEMTICRRGEAPAILSEGGVVMRSFRAIDDEAVQWDERLAHLAVLQKGEIAAFQIGNIPEFFPILLALFHRGLVPLPLGRHLGKTEREAALSAVGASVLIGYDDETRAFFIELLPAAGTPPAWPSPVPDFLKLTSGTTAAPRAIRFRAEQLLEDALQIEETMGITPADLSYGVIPIAHSYGFSHLVTPLLCRGTPLVLSEDRMPRAILNGLACSGASVFPAMPLFFDKLADIGGGIELPKLRLCLSAGAPLPVAVARRFGERFGRKIHSFYGSSECGGIAYDRTGSSGEPERDGFVGQPMSRTNITPQPDGRIVVTGSAVGDGYWPGVGGHGAQEDEALGNGCFTPGDLIEVRSEGYYLAGRVNDIINVAGRKLNPREIEARLFCYPGLREIVIFGVPSRLRHEEAVACVVGDVDETALLEFARSILSLWQVPKAIWKVPRIPVCERGKISRRALAREYLAMQA